MNIHDMEWKKCVRVCLDEASVMTGKHIEGVAQIKEISPDSKFVKALAARKMLALLKTHLTEAVKIVNLITSRAINSKLFSILCSELDSEHDNFIIQSLGGCHRGVSLTTCCIY
jgi:hypothetical protein